MFDTVALDDFVSPIQRIRIEAEWDPSVSLYIKRDDLLPFSFGGNKVRIAREYYDDLKKQGKDCLIGYGNVRSNLCRVLANFGVSYGTSCHIVSPADEDGGRKNTANSVLVQECGAVVHPCKKTEVAQTVEAVIDQCQREGFAPYYINGNQFGQGNEAVPVRAYEKVYREIRKQSEAMGVTFDYIFLATGTGMTQAGLLAGKHVLGGKEAVVGISIARNEQVCTAALKKYLNAFTKENRREAVPDTELVVSDAYLCGGYGAYDCCVENLIRKAYRETGIPLDPTYSGKGFYGMLRYLKEHNIQQKNVLFIHTGGTPLFFDFLKNNGRKASAACRCENIEKLKHFLVKVDHTLPVPLSERVALEEYAEKVLRNGVVTAVEEEGHIVSAALFYCNDQAEHRAYLSLLATAPEHQGKGYGGAVLRAAEKVARAAGMTSLHLHTNVGNVKALALYEKNGYRVLESQGKIHMAKPI